MLIRKTVKEIKDGKFTINPKVTDLTNIGCMYCKYNDICFKKKEDEVIISNWGDFVAFTEEQLAAINSEGSNIIVSAGAGSGKTAVLTERVIRKLKSGISVDRLLVLTFTNEAASEMKSRIRASITENKLYEQLDLLEQAYITTFDSYALSLVKKYHLIW